MGVCTRDKEGNIVKQTPAQFIVEDDGSCVAVGIIDSETLKINEPVSAIYGDWDAAGDLEQLLDNAEKWIRLEEELSPEMVDKLLAKLEEMKAIAANYEG